LANKAKVLVGVLLVLLLGNQTYSQSPEILRIQYAYLPNSNVLESNDSINVQISEFTTSFYYPFKPGNQWTTLVGGVFSIVFPNSEANELNSRLYFIGLQGIITYEFKHNNQLVGIIIPAISSTLQDIISMDDFLTQASLGYFKEVNDKFTFGVGCVYTSSFGFPQLLPLISLVYQPNSTRYELTFPSYIQVTWNFDQRFSYALKASVNGSQFNASKGAEFNNIQVDAVNFSRILIGPEVNFRLKNQLYLSLYGGLAARRIFDLNSETGMNQDLGLQNMAFLSTKISIKPKE
jgi:hypothetical protein